MRQIIYGKHTKIHDFQKIWYSYVAQSLDRYPVTYDISSMYNQLIRSTLLFIPCLDILLLTMKMLSLFVSHFIRPISANKHDFTTFILLRLHDFYIYFFILIEFSHLFTIVSLRVLIQLGIRRYLLFLRCFFVKGNWLNC